MARHMFGDNPIAYRAAISRTVTYEGQDPEVYTFYAGPFGSKAPASAAIAREKKGDGTRWGYHRKTTGYVEFATNWERA